uniref:Uncharacterized protein n=1 Tax=Anguilla anguilla TaxID=7936 RepID=A0A0E9Y0H1_ANGAN
MESWTAALTSMECKPRAIGMMTNETAREDMGSISTSGRRYFLFLLAALHTCSVSISSTRTFMCSSR